MTHLHAGWRVALAVMTCLAGLAAPAAQNKDIKGEAARLIALLELRPGSAVADIGAGSGEMTFEIARQLGETSRVYSTDINPKTVQALKAGAAAADLKNVIVLEGHADRTNLPDGCCDAVFVRHVYHHFGDPPTMNASIMQSLKPGGRFAVMDFPPDKPGTGTIPPALRASGDTHGVATATAVAELKEAGFEILEVLPEWPGRLFLVLSRRPHIQ